MTLLVAVLIFIAVLFWLASLKAGTKRISAPQPPPKIEPRFASEEQKNFVFIRDGGHCVHCGRLCVRTRQSRPDQAHFDHIRPYSRGGETETYNLQLLCRDCNTIKGAKFTG